MAPRPCQRRLRILVLCLLSHFSLTTSLASPSATTSANNISGQSSSQLPASTSSSHDQLFPPSLGPVLLNDTIPSHMIMEPDGGPRHPGGMLISWLWGFVWGEQASVSVVDRTPTMKFAARPAAFGPSADVLGYMIRIEDFSVPCDGQDDEDDGGDGGEIDDGDEPWWPGGGSDRSWPRWRLMSEPNVVVARDARHGCPKLCVRGEHQPEASETWIAMVMRGGCTFVDKVREAQRFGAKAVVVGGQTAEQDTHGDGLVQMYSLGDSTDIKVPSVYITHSSYNTLSSLIASSNTSTWGLRTVSVEITIDPSGWDWYSPILTFLILLFLPSTLTLVTLLIHRIRSARAARRERAPVSVVHNLPWLEWQGQQTVSELEKLLHNPKKAIGPQLHGTTGLVTGEGTPEPSTSHPPGTEEVAQTPAVATQMHWYDTQGECAICLEDFVTGDKVRVLPCRHIFHMEEVDDWLIRRKKLCPICKRDVTLPLGAPQPSEDGHVDEENTVGSPPANERTPLLSSSR